MNQGFCHHGYITITSNISTHGCTTYTPQLEITNSLLINLSLLSTIWHAISSDFPSTHNK